MRRLPARAAPLIRPTALVMEVVSASTTTSRPYSSLPVNGGVSRGVNRGVSRCVSRCVSGGFEAQLAGGERLAHEGVPEDEERVRVLP